MASKELLPRNLRRYVVYVLLVLLGSLSTLLVSNLYVGLDVATLSKGGSSTNARPRTSIFSMPTSEFYRLLMLDTQKVLASTKIDIPLAKIEQPFANNSQILLWDLYLPEVACPDMRRIGNIGDGGKFVCGLSHLENINRDVIKEVPGAVPKCVIYSYGISIDSVFELNVENITKCEIHAFDPTIGNLPPVLRPNVFNLGTNKWERKEKLNITFHKVALSVSSGPTSSFSYTETLLDSMVRLNHSFIDILKVDVEGSEWVVFEHLLKVLGMQNYRKSLRVKATLSGIGKGKSTTSTYKSPSSTQIADAELTLPFGQLLIELHYHSMESMDNFFRGMRAAGFFIFSREVNLLPTMFGHKPFAAEYSFINPATFYRHGGSLGLSSGSPVITSIDTSIPTADVDVNGGHQRLSTGGFTAGSVPMVSFEVKVQDSNAIATVSDVSLAVPRTANNLLVPRESVSSGWLTPVNAVIYYLTRKVRVKMMAVALEHLYFHFYQQFPFYPVMIFHDDLDSVDCAYLQAAVPGMKLYFQLIKLDLPEFLRSEKLPERTKCSFRSSTIGYRHMCMFHAGVIHDYILGRNGRRLVRANLPPHFPLKDTEFLMRLDDDGYLTSPIGYDMFKFMKLNRKKYGFVSTLQDEAECVRGLWNHTRKFYEEHADKYNLPPLNTPSNDKGSGLSGSGSGSRSGVSTAFSGRPRRNEYKKRQQGQGLSQSQGDRGRSIKNGRMAAGTSTGAGRRRLSTVSATRDLAPSRKIFFPDWLDGETFYNNFEISHMSIWTHPLWLEYLYNEATIRGVYEIRWGDAPLHTLGVSMIVPVSQVHSFVDIGYRHDPFINQVAAGLPPPNVDPFKIQIYNCNFFVSWQCGLWNGDNFQMNSSFNNATNTPADHMMTHNKLRQPSWIVEDEENLLSKPGDVPELSTLAEVVAMASQLTRYKTNLLNMYKLKGMASETNSSVAGPINAAMFTFGHYSRESYLSDTLQSMFDGYAGPMKCTIVVFYYKMDVNLVKKRLSPVMLRSIKFVYVELNLVVESPTELALPLSRREGSNTCKSSSKPEELAASDFFVEQAFTELIRMGYNWFFRFADDSRLIKPVQYNVFEMMQSYGKKYGFIGAARNTPECVVPLWEKAIQHCETLNATAMSSASASKSTSTVVVVNDISKYQCSDVLLSKTKWPRGVDVYSNFEISHRSVWETRHFKYLLSGMKKVTMSSIVSSPDQRVNKLLDNYFLYEYSDSTIHTLNMLMSLSALDIHRFRDITYELTRRAAPKVKTGKPVVTTRPLPLLDSYFSPYRFGWLGGDVASSFALPDPKCFSIVGVSSGADTGSDKKIGLRKNSGHDCVQVPTTSSQQSSSQHTEIDGNVEITLENLPTRYVWLFGDSLIGTSSDKRRLEAQMVSNTVGIAQMAVGSDTSSSISSSSNSESLTLQQMQYYWGMKMISGEPKSIFDSKVIGQAVKNQYEFVNVDGAVYWPTDGLSVLATTSSSNIATKAIIIGQLVKSFTAAAPSEAPKSDGILDDMLTGLDFEDFATVLMVVSNAFDTPNFWKYESVLAPHTIRGSAKIWATPPPPVATGAFDQYASSSSGASAGSSTATKHIYDMQRTQADFFRSVDLQPRYKWVSMAASSGLSYALETDHIYLLGNYIPARSKRATSFDVYGTSERDQYQALARVLAGDVLKGRMDSLEFLYSVSNKPTWAHYPSALQLQDPTKTPVAHKSMPMTRMPEASLYFESGVGRWVLVTIVENTHFSMCTSAGADITGEWTCVSDDKTAISAPWTDSGLYNVYAGRAHPEFLAYATMDSSGSNSGPHSGSGRSIPIILSYVANTRAGPGVLVEEEHYKAYLPKFVHAEVTLSSV